MRNPAHRLKNLPGIIKKKPKTVGSGSVAGRLRALIRGLRAAKALLDGSNARFPASCHVFGGSAMVCQPLVKPEISLAFAVLPPARNAKTPAKALASWKKGKM
jgi:hypothetical protein